MKIDPEAMPRITVRKTVTIEYGGEYSHRRLAEMLGLRPEHMSTAGLREYIEAVDGDLSELTEAIMGNGESATAIWTATPVQ